ncbi:hypothetical protein M5D96_007761 [Drosophila gunungcola]|uniref:Uncharacterized protein n=1 Tax=Drosophila gunungcola TaxID=103775 RepID=A0A9P9YLG0_9MUSC|nr:hypothetical protein M5D96_007761 [Drosophila gunungcola]
MLLSKCCRVKVDGLCLSFCGWLGFPLCNFERISVSVPSANIKTLVNNFPNFPFGHALLLLSLVKLRFRSVQNIFTSFCLFVLTRIYLSLPLPLFYLVLAESELNGIEWIGCERRKLTERSMNFDFRTICALFTLDYLPSISLNLWLSCEILSSVMCKLREFIE